MITNSSKQKEYTYGRGNDAIGTKVSTWRVLTEQMLCVELAQDAIIFTIRPTQVVYADKKCDHDNPNNGPSV